MNKVGLHIAYLRSTPYEFDLGKTIPLVKQSSMDVLEVSVPTLLDLSREERRTIRKIAEDNNLILTANGGPTEECDVSADNAAVREKGIEFCKRLLEATADIGSNILCGINYSQWLRRPQKLLTYEEKQRIWGLSVESLKKIMPTAEDLNIQYCFEVVNRFEGFLLNTAEEGIRFVRDVESANAKILLDTYHMNIEENNLFHAISSAMQENVLGHLHVGESNRRIPGIGESHFRWQELFDTLKKINYEGHIVMEPFVRMGIPTAMNACVWRNLTTNQTIADFMQDARAGANFIRSGLENSKINK